MIKTISTICVEINQTDQQTKLAQRYFITIQKSANNDNKFTTIIISSVKIKIPSDTLHYLQNHWCEAR